jgi:hypothetical protein
MHRPLLLAALAHGLTLGLAASTWAQDVPLSGFRSDLAQLEGTWCGTYESAESGRYGALRFHLAAGADTARGFVVMMAPPPAEGAPAPEPQRLEVRFVEVEPGTLRGVVAPYDDPVCGWELETRFTGWIEDGLIEGVFTSCGRQVDTVPQSGRWRAQRLADPTAPCPPILSPPRR